MLTNTATRYGSVARTFHWTIAALILVNIVLALVGDATPQTGATSNFLQALYSTHKTIGVTVLALVILRVIWTIMQPRPVSIHPERRMETLAAETAHWVLYAAIFLLPLSGWALHSAEVGFAPIWWPLPQNLPLIPKSEDLAHTAAAVHWAAGIVLGLTLAAHISGALKHAMFDKDGTLSRMWRGTDAGDAAAGHGNKAVPALVAVVVWVATVGGAVVAFAPTHDDTATTAARSVATSDWAVQDGTLTITITQLGAQVDGSFTNWQADIAYDDATGTGQVEAVIDTASLALGTVTDQAKGPTFFDVTTHAQATFTGDITRVEGAAHTAIGSLILVGQTVPVTLNFNLEVADGIATMTGSTQLDRRDYNMGADYPDETSVGFAVDVSISLTAGQT